MLELPGGHAGLFQGGDNEIDPSDDVERIAGIDRVVTIILCLRGGRNSTGRTVQGGKLANAFTAPGEFMSTIFL